MKSNLTPTTITDKNGKVTTVHKKPRPASASKLPTLPSPEINTSSTSQSLSAAERRRLSFELVGLFLQHVYPPEIFGNNFPDGAKEKAQGYFRKLEPLSDELVSKLSNRAGTGSGNGAFILVDEDKSEEYLMSYLYLSEDEDDYAKIFEAGRGFSFNLPDAVNSISAYPQLEDEKGSEDYYLKVKALTGVVTAIQHRVPNEDNWGDHRDGKFLMYTQKGEDQLARINNGRLINLILEYPERWEQIADIVVDRRTDDANLIRSILTSETNAMSEGTL